LGEGRTVHWPFRTVALGRTEWRSRIDSRRGLRAPPNRHAPRRWSWVAKKKAA